MAFGGESRRASGGKGDFATALADGAASEDGEADALCPSADRLGSQPAANSTPSPINAGRVTKAA